MVFNCGSRAALQREVQSFGRVGAPALQFTPPKFRLSVHAHTAFHCNTAWKGNTP